MKSYCIKLFGSVWDFKEGRIKKPLEYLGKEGWDIPILSLFHHFNPKYVLRIADPILIPPFCQFFCNLTGKSPRMNAYHRYRVINNLLKKSGTASLVEMIDECELVLGKPPGQRTIEKDIEDMRYSETLGFYAPIIYDHGKEKYRYSDENFSIDGIPLLEDDLKNLVFAAAVLNQYSDISYFNHFQGSVQKIVNATNLRRRQENESEFKFIDFEKNPLVSGNEYLERIVDHIIQGEVIEVRYQAFTKETPSTYVLHPHYLKEYRGRWYMMAMDENAGIEKTFGLDRIQQIKVLDNRHYKQSQRDFDLYFQQAIGIMISEGDPQEIVVAFTDFQAKYVISQPIHHSQTLLNQTDDQGRKYFKFHLIPNFELTAILLGWSDQVEVISPEWYREDVKKIVEGMGRVYENQ